MHLENYNDFSTTPRSWCTAGSRHFYISSRGDLSRCAGFWYGHKDILGSVKDQELRRSIFFNKNEYKRCQAPMCTMECDGYSVEQQIEAKTPTLHRGGKLTDYRLAGKDFCTLMIHLTAFCNMKCAYCCAQGWMEAHKGQDMTPEEWKDTATFFTESFDTGMVQVMGGEPTIKKGWQDIVRIFIDAGWRVEILTNMVKDKEIVDFVKSLPPERRYLCFIYVSLHPTQKAFDLKKIMDSFNEMRTLGCSYACSLVLTPENIRITQEMQIREKMESIGVTWFGTVPDYGYAKF